MNAKTIAAELEDILDEAAQRAVAKAISEYVSNASYFARVRVRLADYVRASVADQSDPRKPIVIPIDADSSFDDLQELIEYLREGGG